MQQGLVGHIDEKQSTKKCVVVGDGGVGKTSLLISFATGAFPKEHCPPMSDHFQTSVTVDGARVELDVWDTDSRVDFDRLRPLCYPGTDVFILCFSITSTASFEHITEGGKAGTVLSSRGWYPELNQESHGTPIILVGMKADNRKEVQAQCDARSAEEASKRAAGWPCERCGSRSEQREVDKGTRAHACTHTCPAGLFKDARTPI